MGKLTKKDRIKVLEWQVKTLIQSMTNVEKWSDYADSMLTELNHALPDPEYDAKCEAQEADVDASLARHRERLGLNKPQLKQLDQSIFDGLDEKWRFAAVDKDGSAFAFVISPDRHGTFWGNRSSTSFQRLSKSKVFDTSNWQNSLIERDTAKELLEIDLSSELTGSDLCRAMFERGDNYIMCVTGALRKLVVIDTLQDGKFYSFGTMYENPIPINNQGEPLTAAEVGL